MSDDIQIIGSYLSPYVRKVLVALELKGLSYEIDPIVPFYGNAQFGSISPLRRIPVLIDKVQDLIITDSTVILEYLEEQYPNVSLYPDGASDRARARWFEEFADSRLGEVFIWRIFNQNIRRYVWGLDKDEETFEKATKFELPEIMNYLESEAPAAGFLFNHLSVADIALASFFRNLQFARVKLDHSRWPKIMGLVERTLSVDAFRKLSIYEDASLPVAPPEVRTALMDTDAPLTTETLGTQKPVKGPMTQI